MENATNSASLQIINLSDFDKYVLIWGYITIVAAVFLTGFCIAKISDRKRK